MKVGLLNVFQSHRDHTDAETYRNETKLALEAEAMGFDMVCAVEHHFTDYSMCPDNAEFLSYVAAKTSKIKLMPAGFILPWNDPLRVVEKTAMLDILSGGRVILGMGRGLARREFIGFRTDMSESRERFDEAAEIIIKGLETGFVEADGRFYKQPRVEVRPRPPTSFKGRSYMAGMSPASVEAAARLGLGCLKFSSNAWDTAKAEIDAYRASFKRHHQIEAPPIVCADFIVCFEDSKKTAEYRDRYLAAYYSVVMKHYEMRGDHFAQTKGYDTYAENAKVFQSMEEQEALNSWTSANLCGTPDQIVETLRARRELIGALDLAICFSFGSMPYDEVWSQLRLFADKVLPVVKSWSNSDGARIAAQ